MSTPLLKRKRVEPPAISMINLNDDVLREIFKRLNPEDLLVIGRVCSKFRGIVEDGYKISNILTLYCDSTGLFLSTRSDAMISHYDASTCTALSYCDIFAALRIFGPHLISLGIDLTDLGFWSQSSIVLILTTIVNCCRSLEVLKLQKFRFSDDMILHLRSILARIFYLDMEECCFENNSNDESTLLAFRSKCNAFDIVKPKFDVFSTSFNPSDRAIESFLSNNPQLKPFV